MKRPYIPLKVRLAVLERQAFVERYPNPNERQNVRESYEMHCYKFTLRGKIRFLLDSLFLGKKTELDHDPALSLRKRRGERYIPDANDPRYLVYRRKDHHLQKTIGRKPGAERTVTTKGSDIWLKTKFQRLKKPVKRSRKILSASSFTRPARKRRWPERPMTTK